MTHVFDLVDGGIAWVDSGWTDPLASSHVCHYLDGIVTATDTGWLLLTPDRIEVPIHVDSRDVYPEGNRESAREGIQLEFDRLALEDD